MTKTLVNEAIKEMPEDFEIEDFFEKLVIIDSLKRAKYEYIQGKILTQAEVESKMAQRWQ
jgi:hypothetical protein